MPPSTAGRHSRSFWFELLDPYNHYSLLATVEQVWGLPLLGYASDTAQVTPMTEFLTR